MKDKILNLFRFAIILSIIGYSYFIFKDFQKNFNKYKENNLKQKIIKNNDVLLAYKIKENWEKYLKDFKKVKNIHYKFKIDKDKKLLIFETYDTTDQNLYNQHVSKTDIQKFNKTINSSFNEKYQTKCQSLVFQTFFKNGWKINYKFYIKDKNGGFKLLNSFTVNNCIKIPFDFKQK